MKSAITRIDDPSPSSHSIDILTQLQTCKAFSPSVKVHFVRETEDSYVFRLENVRTLNSHMFTAVSKMEGCELFHQCNTVNEIGMSSTECQTLLRVKREVKKIPQFVVVETSSSPITFYLFLLSISCVILTAFCLLLRHR